MASITVSGNLPEELDQRLATLLRLELDKSLTDTAASGLRSAIRVGITPQYERDWAVFNYLYFSANFLKAHLVARSLAKFFPRRSLRMLDLGCGGGAATAAFVGTLHKLGLQVSKVVALDSSSSQLEVFRSVVLPWISAAPLGAEVNLINSDLLNFIDIDDGYYDVVLMSYVLGELSEESCNRLRDALLRKCSGRASLVVIIESDSLGRGVAVEILGLTEYVVPYDKVTFKCSSLVGLGLQVFPKFHEHKKSELFEQYIQCWRQHDIELLERLFSKNCEYQINGVRTLTGLDAVIEYWNHNASRQRNVEVHYSLIFSNSNQVGLNWSATFDRIDTGDRRHLDGIMLIDLVGPKISRLREYYTQHFGPDRVSDITLNDNSRDSDV